MAKKTRDELKSYFEIGDIPTDLEFADLIDSFDLAWNEVTVDLASADWSSNTQTKTISGLTPTSDIIAYPPSERVAFLAYGKAQISVTAIGTDSITFTCTTAPTEDINDVIIYWKWV